METIKIKVNLPKHVYEILEVDMEVFGFVKSDGSVNKNLFINHLIKNYTHVFVGNENSILKKILGQVKIKEEDFSAITSVLFEESFKKEGNYTKDLQFIVSKENLDLFEEIIAVYLKNRSISQFFREMLIMYTSFAMDKRQEIMFKDPINKIKRIISNHKKALVSFTDGARKTIEFYDIAGTGEQIFNYVIGVESDGKGKREIVSYRIQSLKTVIELPNSDVEIKDDEIEKLELMKYQGPVFAINEILDVKVKLTERGKTLWRVWIHDRPKPYKIEENLYYFKADLFHLIIYFYKFGTEAKILSPEKIKNFMRDCFEEAYKLYLK